MAEQFRPDWFSRPGDTISALMARRNLDAETVALRMHKDRAFVLRLIAGTEPIGDETAASLANCIGGTADFWQRRQMNFEAAVSRIASEVPEADARSWTRSLPLREMRTEGWLTQAVTSHPLHEAMKYFGVTGPDEWRKQYTEFATQFSYRTSPTFASKIGALAAWLRQGELEAQHTKCEPWDAAKFRGAVAEIRKLTRLSQPGAFIPRLRRLCAAAGVSVVFVRAPSGCRASGATKFVGDDKAIIILSFRYLSDDHFWFSFFHEAGHLLLHGITATFIDGEAAQDSKYEREANAFAASTLIPPREQERLLNLRPRMREIVRFAVSIGISPGIVVGQLQHHEIIGPGQLNGLKRRYTWDQLTTAAS